VKLGIECCIRGERTLLAADEIRAWMKAQRDTLVGPMTWPEFRDQQLPLLRRRDPKEDRETFHDQEERWREVDPDDLDDDGEMGGSSR
jgi:hypothetical protein